MVKREACLYVCIDFLRVPTQKKYARRRTIREELFIMLSSVQIIKISFWDTAVAFGKIVLGAGRRSFLCLFLPPDVRWGQKSLFGPDSNRTAARDEGYRWVAVHAVFFQKKKSTYERFYTSFHYSKKVINDSTFLKKYLWKKYGREVGFFF